MEYGGSKSQRLFRCSCCSSPSPPHVVSQRCCNRCHRVQVLHHGVLLAVVYRAS